MRIFFLLSLFSLLSIYSCKEKDTLSDIKGSIYEGNNKVIYLLDLTKKGAVPDSTILNFNGDFDFNLEITEPKDVILYFDISNHIRLLLLPGEHLTITADYANLDETYRVNGSPNSEFLQEIMQKNISCNLEIDSLNSIYRANETNQRLLDIMNQLQAKALKIFAKHRNELEEIINANTHPLVSYIVLSLRLGPQNLFDSTKDIEWFKKVSDAIQETYPETTIAVSIKNFVESVELRMFQKLTTEQRISIGNIAPEIALPNQNGDTVRLSSFRGKYVLVDFWASWCKPCRLQNQNLLKVYNSYRWRKFEIYQVSLDNDKAEWIKAIRNDYLYWTNVSDLKMWDCQASKDYGINGIPSNFLLDPEGRIIARDLRENQLEAKLKEYIKIPVEPRKEQQIQLQPTE